MLRLSCVCALCIPAAGALGQVAFDTFNGSPLPTTYWLGGGPQFPTRLAWRFTAAAGGEVASVTLAAYRTSAVATPATVVFYSANGTLVGASLGSASVALPAGQFSAPVTAGVSGITLAPGQDYFLSLQLPQFVEAQWRLYGPPQVPGPQAAWIGAGPWTYFDDPQAYYPAFRVTVPGPATLAAGFGVLGLAARRRRGGALCRVRS